METIEKDIEKIKGIIERIKPRYTILGGDIEFVDIQGKDVLIQPTGFCWR